MFARTTRKLAPALALTGLFLIPALAQAQFDVGARGGFYSDADAGFLGVELLTPLPIPVRGWYFNPNFEYVFVDDGHLYTLNFDAHYDLNTRAPYDLWVGGGPAVIFSKIDPPFGCRGCSSDSQTDLGLNLLAGIGFWRNQAIRPYIQGKVTLSDNTEAAIAFGVRFH